MGQRQNAQRTSFLISMAFHVVIVLALVFFAAREGLLGKQLKKIAVEMVKEPPQPKPAEPEKPKPEVPKLDAPKQPPAEVAATPKTPAPSETRPGPAAPPSAPSTVPSVAPPAAELSGFAFDGGKAVETTSDPSQLYKGFVEYELRSRWARPTDVRDNDFVAEVEVSIDSTGRLSEPQWKKLSGNSRWDASVRGALAEAKAVSRPPPKGFPDRVLIRFDVQQLTDALNP